MNKVLKVLREPITADKLNPLIPTIILGFQGYALALLLFAPHAIKELKIANALIADIVFFILALIPISYIAVSVSGSVIFFLFYYLNEYIIAARGRPINFLDIFCISDAIKVANQYPFIINSAILWKFLLTAIVTAVSCILIKILYSRKDRSYPTKCLFSLIGAVLSLLLLAAGVYSTVFFTPSMVWDEIKYINDTGLLHGIYSEYRHSIVSTPNGYSVKAAGAILEEYGEKNISASGNEPPTNIIVIMNESFADFSLIGEPDLTADPLPGIHSLSGNNVAKGRLAVNVYGGSTCNTEYEFVTGLPLAFLPKNTMPFAQYHLGSSLSEAREMAAQGYSCTPLHGFLGNEYRRNIIYSELFENEFISAEKFTGEVDIKSDYNIFELDDLTSIPTFGDNLEYINRFISDAECYRKIESIMKNDNENGKKSFTFTVTIQNHGSYAINTDYEQLNFTGTDINENNNYITLSSISDRAFIDFLHRLEEYPERTVVIMFGDHQPYIHFDSYKTRFSEYGNDYQLVSDSYIVPYIAWANYDMEWNLPEIMSVNYLLTAVKASCGMELSSMDKLRYEAMNQYPVITWNFAMNTDGEYLHPEEPMASEIIQKYNVVNYYKLFDS